MLLEGVETVKYDGTAADNKVSEPCKARSGIQDSGRQLVRRLPPCHLGHTSLVCLYFGLTI